MQGLDLFGQVAVTWPEVIDWCARVAGITPDSPRFLPYVRAWDVPQKIAAAKLSGLWWREGFNPAPASNAIEFAPGAELQVQLPTWSTWSPAKRNPRTRRPGASP